jgi:hypothetical protein
MSWYGIDAIDKAFSRTKKSLFEPFNFWKWIKLAIIIFFVGTTSSYGGSGSSYQTGIQELRDNLSYISPGQISDFPVNMSGIDLDYIQSLPLKEAAISFAALLLLLILVFLFISSVMEFVFVEALVRNEVHLREYFKKFLKNGLSLLIIRIALVILSFIVFLISIMPFISILLGESSKPSLLVVLSKVFWFIGVITVLVLFGLVINSFLSLAIPISIYKETEILSAFSMIYTNFRKGWKEVVMYWFIRLIIGIGIGVVAIILFTVLILSSGIVFLAIDGILYFLFSSFMSEPLLWILLLPFAIIELVLFFVALLLISVPLGVFPKYYLLSFLEAWFADSEIPFFDSVLLEPEKEFNESEPNV